MAATRLVAVLPETSLNLSKNTATRQPCFPLCFNRSLVPGIVETSNFWLDSICTWLSLAVEVPGVLVRQRLYSLRRETWLPSIEAVNTMAPKVVILMADYGHDPTGSEIRIPTLLSWF